MLHSADDYIPPCKFITVSNMLNDLKKPRLAAYMRKFKDENLIRSFALVVLEFTHPTKKEDTLWQLEECGAL